MDINYFWLLIQYIKWFLYMLYHIFAQTSKKKIDDTKKYDDL